MKFLLFLKRHICFILCCTAGILAGVWGFFAGCAVGLLIELILLRSSEEKNIRHLLEQGTPGIIDGEPFPGAVYVSAIVFSGLNNEQNAVHCLRTVFEKYPDADWSTFCRAAASVEGGNEDLYTECLAALIRKNDMKKTETVELLQNIFSVLTAAEYARTEKDGKKPSKYLAELLDYTYVSSELSAAYHVLGLEPGADSAAVKAAHRKLAAACHPDKSGGRSAEFEKIQNAYELIEHRL